MLEKIIQPHCSELRMHCSAYSALTDMVVGLKADLRYTQNLCALLCPLGCCG